MVSSAEIRPFRWAWWGLFASALALYTLTLQRHCGWQDSGCFQLQAVIEPYVSSDFTSDLGLALGHPSYIAVIRAAARLFPLAPVWGVNWVSSWAMAVAVANVGYLVFRLTGGRALYPAVLAGVMLMMSHVVWWLSTIAEVYTSVAALLTTELICLVALVERPSMLKACLLAFLAGLHWGFHNFALLAMPVYGVAILALVFQRRVPRSALLMCSLCFLAGAWPLIRMVAAGAQDLGLLPALKSLLIGAYGPEVMGFSARHLAVIKGNAALFLFNFLNPVWALFAVGLWQMMKRGKGWASACVLFVLAIHALFFVRYFVADQALFAVPTLTLMAVVAGAGADAVSRRLPLFSRMAVPVLALSALIPVGAYAGVNALLHHAVSPVANRRQLPFRDETRYWALPWKQDENSAFLFKEAVLDQTERDAIVIADGTASVVLSLEKVLNPKRVDGREFLENRSRISARKESMLLSDFYRANRHRAWYTVTPAQGYLTDWFLDGSFTFEKRGVLYRIQPCPAK